jgi:tetratricopeptide (TPR) repeat protein
LPLTGLLISAVGNTITVRSGPDQWEAESGQLLLDFEVAPLRGAVTFLDSAPGSTASREQGGGWFALAEQLAVSDPQGSEHAYRKAMELSTVPHYGAYTNLGVLLVESGRCVEALTVFDRALEHFPSDSLLHFNRAVVLEELTRDEDAASSYRKCMELKPDYADAHFNLARLSELRGDKQIALRHYNAYRRLCP